MKNRYIIMSSTLLIAHTPAPLLAGPYLNSLLKKTAPDHIIHKEFSITPDSMVSIENLYGNINIKAGWSENSIVISGMQTNSRHEDDTIEIIHEYIDSTSSRIKTKPTLKKTKNSMDITVIVPNNIILSLITKNGNIIDNAGLSGAVTATTDNGRITLHGTHATIHATAQNRGTVTITNAKKDVTVQTNKGYIYICYDEFGTGCKLWAKSERGKINLDIPDGVNAEFEVESKKGTVNSRVQITQSITSTLDRESRRRFSQKAKGCIGHGRDSEIKMVAGSSININNITI